MRRYGRRFIAIILFCFLIIGCVSPRPVLYQNNHLQNVGKIQAELDVSECQEIAEQYVSSTSTAEGVVESTVIGAGVGAASGAVAGAIRGSAGSSSMVGAAAGATIGLIRGLFQKKQPNHAYKAFVDRCLAERGYDSVGWD